MTNQDLIAFRLAQILAEMFGGEQQLIDYRVHLRGDAGSSTDREKNEEDEVEPFLDGGVFLLAEATWARFY